MNWVGGNGRVMRKMKASWSLTVGAGLFEFGNEAREIRSWLLFSDVKLQF